MLDREQLDVVNICTPSGLHGEPACLAMRSGRHVIVEKPMEITLEAIDAMLRVHEEAGVKLAVISQRRFDAAARRVYDLIQEGAIGRLVLGTAHIPLWRSQAYYDSAGWRGTWAFDGGGVLMNQGIHSIDLLQWLMGPVRRVTAYTDTLVHQIETEDVAVAALRFASGALGAITATTGAYPGLATRIDVLGDKGSAIIERERLRHLHLARDDSQEVGPYGLQLEESAEEDGPQAQEGTHAMQIADMIRAIREDGTPLVDGHAARKPVQIILAVYESARTGQEVQLS
jgi:predicted dehydrogenase